MQYILDASRMRTNEEAHDYLKAVLELPEYYGKNLDALYDVMTERADVEIQILNLTEENLCARRIIKVLKAANVNIK